MAARWIGRRARSESERREFSARAVSIFRELVADDATNRDARRGLTLALLTAAASSSTNDEVEAICRTLLDEDPAGIEAARALSIVLDRKAATLSTKHASHLHAKALSLRRMVTATHPDAPLDTITRPGGNASD